MSDPIFDLYNKYSLEPDRDDEIDIGSTLVTTVLCYNCGDDSNIPQRTEIEEHDGYRIKAVVWVDTSKHECDDE